MTLDDPKIRAVFMGIDRITSLFVTVRYPGQPETSKKFDADSTIGEVRDWIEFCAPEEDQETGEAPDPMDLAKAELAREDIYR